MMSALCPNPESPAVINVMFILNSEEKSENIYFI